MVFKQDLPPPEDLEGRHGLVLQIGSGTKEGAQKICDSLEKNDFCLEKVESVFNFQDLWIFLWPKGVSVNIPAILRTANHFPMRQWAADSLGHFLKNNPNFYSENK